MKSTDERIIAKYISQKYCEECVKWTETTVGSGMDRKHSPSFACPAFISLLRASPLPPGERSRYSAWLRAGRSGDRIPVEARFSAPVQTGPGAHPASCTMGTGSFPGVKSGRGVTLTPHPLLVPWS